MNKRITSLLLVFVMALSLLTACGKSLSLDKTELTFTAAGETAQLTADTKSDALNWTSSDESGPLLPCVYSRSRRSFALIL